MVKQISVSQLNQEFEDLLDEMYFTYHYHPTYIPNNGGLTEEDRAQEHIGRGYAQTGVSGSDPKWCNGLPANGHGVSNGRIR